MKSLFRSTSLDFTEGEYHSLSGFQNFVIDCKCIVEFSGCRLGRLHLAESRVRAFSMTILYLVSPFSRLDILSDGGRLCSVASPRRTWKWCDNGDKDDQSTNKKLGSRFPLKICSPMGTHLYWSNQISVENVTDTQKSVKNCSYVISNGQLITARVTSS